MGWENRNGKRYYYSKKRINGRVVSMYAGNSVLAELEESVNELAALQREQRRLDQQIAAAEFTELAETPPDLLDCIAQAKVATVAALTAAGYHQHKRGEWRKKRDMPKQSKLGPIYGPETHQEWALRIVDAMSKPNPSKETRAQFRMLLDERPELADNFGTLPQMARKSALKRFANMPALEESLRFQLKQMRKDLAGAYPSPLEVLLVDAVVLAYQDYFSFQVLYAQRTSERVTLNDMQQWEKILSAKETRYLRCIGELARVRRLLNLPSPQVNINLPGGQQVNIQGNPNETALPAKQIAESVDTIRLASIPQSVA